MLTPLGGGRSSDGQYIPALRPNPGTFLIIGIEELEGMDSVILSGPHYRSGHEFRVIGA
jgi:hypothetical protein